jgi:nucleotide-binding universal stress UspA family protein
MDGIVVGLDGTPAAAAALRWALDHGARHDLPVTALVPPRVSEQLPVDALIAGAVGPDKRVGHRSTCDPMALSLAHAASSADLVVLGVDHDGWLHGLVHGAPEVMLARSARCPTVIVRDRPVPVDAPAVVGIDGSPASQAALRWAIDDSATTARPVVAVNAWSNATPPFGAILADDDVARMVRAAADDLDAIVDIVERGVGGWPVERRSVAGAPVDVLLTDAEDAAMLVVGTCGPGRARRALFGAVSEHVAHRAASTVIVVPPARVGRP